MADIIELDVSKPVPEHGVADLLDRLTTRLALTEVKVGSTQYQLENLGSGLEDTMLQLREQLERQSSALEGAMSRIKRLEDEALAQRKTAEDCPLVAKAPLITKGTVGETVEVLLFTVDTAKAPSEIEPLYECEPSFHCAETRAHAASKSRAFGSIIRREASTNGS